LAGKRKSREAFFEPAQRCAHMIAVSTTISSASALGVAAKKQQALFQTMAMLFQRRIMKRPLHDPPLKQQPQPSSNIQLAHPLG
jgi:hypothetical protein